MAKVAHNWHPGAVVAALDGHLRAVRLTGAQLHHLGLSRRLRNRKCINSRT